MNKTIHEKLVKYYYHSYAAKFLEAEVEYMLVAFDANELRLQDALDEVPNADPYEHYIKLFDVKNGDGIAIGKGR